MVVRLAALIACAATLTACGSGTSDSEQIAGLVKQAGSDPASVCDHVSQALLARVGGRSACRRRATASAKDPSTHARSIRIRGRTASALVMSRTGAHTINLVKLGSSWTVVGVR